MRVFHKYFSTRKTKIVLDKSFIVEKSIHHVDKYYSKFWTNLFDALLIRTSRINSKCTISAEQGSQFRSQVQRRVRRGRRMIQTVPRRRRSGIHSTCDADGIDVSIVTVRRSRRRYRMKVKFSIVITAESLPIVTHFLENSSPRGGSKMVAIKGSFLFFFFLLRPQKRFCFVKEGFPQNKNVWLEY